MSTGSAHDAYETRSRLRGADAADEFARWRELPPRLHPVEPAPLPPDVWRLLHRLRLRYIREAGPAVLARARDEGWDFTDVLKVLLAEEAAGRDRSTREMHRKAARLPSGKTFDAWDPKASAIPGDAQWALRSLDWIGRAENLVLVGPSRDWQEPLRRGDRPCRDRSRPPRQFGSRSSRSQRRSPARGSMPRPARSSSGSSARSSLWSTTSACCPPGPTRPKRCTAWSTPRTRSVR